MDFPDYKGLSIDLPNKQFKFSKLLNFRGYAKYIEHTTFISIMYQLLVLFFDICLFKKGPQDIPASSGLLFLLIPAYAGISFLILVLSTDAVNAILQVLIEIAFVLGSSKIILYFAKKPERFIQTVCALIATDTLISIFALPVMAALIGQGSALAFFSLVTLMLWHWTVSGHIFSNALSQPFTFGLGIAFLYILVSYQVMALLFPEIIITE